MLIIFGSINMDMVVRMDYMPQAGETVLCPDYDLLPGGKGANQALAAARMGARVALVGCAGDDGYSRHILDAIRRQGVITSGVAQSDRPTGCAFILQEDGGQNRIIVAAGANSDATADQVPDEILRSGSMVLTQMELPADEVFLLIRRAHARGVKIILNLAPAIALPDDILSALHILVVNEIEIAQVAAKAGLTGGSHGEMARAMARKGSTTCIVTLGNKGSFVALPDGAAFHVSALPLEEVVDTTGAGDAYCGTLAACLYAGMTLEDSVCRASAAGSLACAEKGTITAFAYQADIEKRLDEARVTQA
ncbi:MAG TPA: ribokinase [Micavibrio sp.]|jgi:ribokinase